MKENPTLFVGINSGLIKLIKIYKAYAKENSDSEMHISIGDYYCNKEEFYDTAMKYYNITRCLEFNNSEKQSFILKKIQNLIRLK